MLGGKEENNIVPDVGFVLQKANRNQLRQWPDLVDLEDTLLQSVLRQPPVLVFLGGVPTQEDRKEGDQSGGGPSRTDHTSSHLKNANNIASNISHFRTLNKLHVR